jgi:hypothetical protein
VVRSIQPDASLNISEARSIGHAGRGVVIRWGEENGTAVGSGDWVHVEPGEQHWHGALPDDVFVPRRNRRRTDAMARSRFLTLTTGPDCPEDERASEP